MAARSPTACRALRGLCSHGRAVALHVARIRAEQVRRGWEPSPTDRPDASGGRVRTPLPGKRRLQASGPPGVLYDLEIPDHEGEPAEACISLAGPWSCRVQRAWSCWARFPPRGSPCWSTRGLCVDRRHVPHAGRLGGQARRTQWRADPRVVPSWPLGHRRRGRVPYRDLVADHARLTTRCPHHASSALAHGVWCTPDGARFASTRSRGVPDLDSDGTPLTRKQHFVSAAERLWNGHAL